MMIRPGIGCIGGVNKLDSIRFDRLHKVTCSHFATELETARLFIEYKIQTGAKLPATPTRLVIEQKE